MGFHEPDLLGAVTFAYSLDIQRMQNPTTFADDKIDALPIPDNENRQKSAVKQTKNAQQRCWDTESCQITPKEDVHMRVHQGQSN